MIEGATNVTADMAAVIIVANNTPKTEETDNVLEEVPLHHET